MPGLALDRPLGPSEVHQLVADTILTSNKKGRPINVSGLVNPEYCAIETDIRDVDRNAFARLNRDTFPRIANAFVNRLIAAGIIERYWTQSQPHSIYRLHPEKVASLEVLTILEGITTSEFVEALGDHDLRVRCESVVLRAAPTDSLLREAVTVLEGRLRNLLGDEPADRRACLRGFYIPTVAKCGSSLKGTDKKMYSTWSVDCWASTERRSTIAWRNYHPRW